MRPAAVLLLFLLQACSAGAQRERFFPGFRPTRPERPIDTTVVLEATLVNQSGFYDTVGEAIRQVVVDDLAAQFTRPSFVREPGAEFLLRAAVVLRGTFSLSCDVSVTLLEPQTGAALASLARTAPGGGTGDESIRRVADQLVQQVLPGLKDDLAKAFEDPGVLAKRRPRPPETGRLLAEARAAEAAGKYAAAAAAIRRAIENDPANPTPYAGAGALMLRLCDVEGTRALVDARLRRQPNAADLLALAQRARPGGAGVLEGADPAACRAQALNREGVALARERKPVEALARFQAAVEAAPGLIPKADYNAALVLEQLGRPREAVAHYVAAQQAFLLPEEALETLQRIVAVTQRERIAVPESADRRYRVGILRAQQKRYKEAIEELEGALAKAPWLVDAYYNLGLVYDFTAAYGEALRVLRIYLQLAPTTPQTGAVKTKIVELEDRLGLLGKPAN